MKQKIENFTEANKGNKDQFFVTFVAFCKVLLWAAALLLPAFGASAGVILTTLHSFQALFNGESSSDALVQGSDGFFYGTTEYGGANDLGTVFKIETNGQLTKLHSFTGTNDGANPTAGLVRGTDGSFYGTTANGGTNGQGTVFKISTNGGLTPLYCFTGENDGGGPVAALVQGSDGSFYGATPSGDTNRNGTVFRLTIVPEFQAVTLTNTTLSLTWSTEAGGQYQLQYTSDLTSTNWINLNSPFTATGATLSTTDILTNAPQRFYRLAISP